MAHLLGERRHGGAAAVCALLADELEVALEKSGCIRSASSVRSRRSRCTARRLRVCAHARARVRACACVHARVSFCARACVRVSVPAGVCVRASRAAR